MREFSNKKASKESPWS